MNKKRSKLEELRVLGWDAEDVAQLLFELRERLNCKGNNVTEEATVSQKITVQLHKMGFSTNLRGFGMIREAVEYCVENGSDNPITIAVYPTVAERMGSTGKIVERNIRNSIEKAFSNPNTYLLHFVGNIVNGKKVKPTNSEFITLLAESIREGLL